MEEIHSSKDDSRKQDLVALVKQSAIQFVARQAFAGVGDFAHRQAQLRAAVSTDGSDEPQAPPPTAPAASGPRPSDIPREKLTVNSLCSRFHVSRRHLTRLFKRQTGESPGRWLRLVRANAARLLRADGRPLKAVASRLGYKGRASAWRLVHKTD